MTYKNIFIILFIFIIQNTFSQGKLEKQKIATDIGKVKISINIPSDFAPMTLIQVQRKFYGSKPPYIAYTNLREDAEFSISKGGMTWDPKDIELLKSFYSTNIKNLFQKIEMITDTIKINNGLPSIHFEFVGLVEGEKDVMGKTPVIKKYLYLQYILYGKEIIIFNFSSSIYEKENWQPIVNMMMQDIKID